MMRSTPATAPILGGIVLVGLTGLLVWTTACASRPERPPAERIASLPFGLDDLEHLATLAGPGEISFTTREDSGDRTVLLTVVDAPPLRVRRTVIDADRYGEFVPQVVECRVLSAAPHSLRLELEIEVPLSNFVYQLEYDLSRAETVGVSCPEGAFAGSRWRWDFLPLDEGRSTLLCYSSDSRIGNDNMLLNQILAFHPDMETGFSFSSGLALIRAMKSESERALAESPSSDGGDS